MILYYILLLLCIPLWPIQEEITLNYSPFPSHFTQYYYVPNVDSTGQMHKKH